MPTVLYKKKGRVAYIILNRPDRLNAINDEMPPEIERAVQRADSDPNVHVMILEGAGKAFCSGYDLSEYGEQNSTSSVIQDMPWDPIQDYQFMWRNTQHFMALWRAMKPVICKVHGFAVAGGSDIALCADMTIMAEDAEIGYMPTRVWGTPTTAMWVQRLGPERAKRMLFTGDKINGVEAENMGLILKSVPKAKLNEEVELLAQRMATVPINQLAMQKMLVNQAMETSGLMQTQKMATLSDGISGHSPEGIAFKQRIDKVGWKQPEEERDTGSFDWTKNQSI